MADTGSEKATRRARPTQRVFDPKAPSFHDIPQLTGWGAYAVDISWGDLEHAVARYVESYQFDFGDSDFQRGHVWTEAQQIAFVEFGLRGGHSGMNILTNVTGWNKAKTGAMQLVDGKQRLSAVLRFLRNEIPAFGHLNRAFAGGLYMTGPSFRWHVNDLPDRAAILRWYLELNTGGTVHTDAEIAKVRAMLEQAAP